MLRRITKPATAALSVIALVGGVTIALAQGGASGSTASELGAYEGKTLTRLGGSNEGAAFAMTNRSTGNQIIRYRRADNGALTRVGAISTRGTGIGTDLDTQDGLLLSDNHRYLYAVNAGSDNITVFGVNGTRLTFLQKVYAGDLPNSLTLHAGAATSQGKFRTAGSPCVFAGRGSL